MSANNVMTIVQNNDAKVYHLPNPVYSGYVLAKMSSVRHDVIRKAVISYSEHGKQFGSSLTRRRAVLTRRRVELMRR